MTARRMRISVRASTAGSARAVAAGSVAHRATGSMGAMFPKFVSLCLERPTLLASCPDLFRVGARVIEKAVRIRIYLHSACPDAALFRTLTGRLVASGP